MIRIPLEIPDIWDRWNTLRNLCGHNPRIKIGTFFNYKLI